jgi:hypothetical protein
MNNKKKKYTRPHIRLHSIKNKFFYFTPFRSVQDSIDNLYHADKFLAQDGCSCCASCGGSVGCGSCGGACG